MLETKIAARRRLLAPIGLLIASAMPGCRDHVAESTAHGEHAAHEHAAHGEHPTQGSAVESTAAAGNPVQQEMRLLTSALEAAVRAIGAGDVRSIEHQLHRVHAAKEATEAAIREGKYRPPKNADRMGEFHERDEAFHHELSLLVEASRQNDVMRASTQLGAVLRGCPGCHGTFRP